jgi:aquaporin NIP
MIDVDQFAAVNGVPYGAAAYGLEAERPHARRAHRDHSARRDRLMSAVLEQEGASPGLVDERPDLVRRALMEGIGAFAIVVAGCGAIVADSTTGGALGAVGISLVFGLIVMAMIYAGGHLSGAHYNPSVTIAFTLARHFPRREAVVYIAAQGLGGATGAFLLLAAWPDAPADLGATVPSVSAGTALLYEMVLTAFLMFVITAVATDTRAVGAAAAIAIGGTVALDALFGGPVTGASMTPARSLGPALAAGQWSDAWVYLVGPIVGAGIGVFTYELVRGAR